MCIFPYPIDLRTALAMFIGSAEKEKPTVLQRTTRLHPGAEFSTHDSFLAYILLVISSGGPYTFHTLVGIHVFSLHFSQVVARSGLLWRSEYSSHLPCAR